MARITRFAWLRRQLAPPSRLARARTIGVAPARRLHVEALETRRVLAAFTVTTNLDVVDPSDGVLSLREAIADANAAADADTIDFDFGHDGPETIVLTEGELLISEALTISGAGAELLTIDASGNDPTPNSYKADGTRVFVIDDDDPQRHINVTLVGMRLTGGDVLGNGGALSSRERTTLDGLRIVGNGANGMGGGAFLRTDGDAVAIIRNTVFANNVAGTVNFGSSDAGGAAVYSYAESSITITGSQFNNNRTVDKAHNDANVGGLKIFTRGNSSVRVEHSTISGNVADDYYGGAYARSFDASTVEFEYVEMVGNTGDSGTGAHLVAGDTSSITVRSSRFADNETEGVFGRGGGLRVLTTYSGRIEIATSTVANNRGLIGGGIYADARDTSVLILSDLAVTGNHASNTSRGNQGGGIHATASGSAQLTIQSSTISGNRLTGTHISDHGGGVSTFATGDAVVTIRSSTIVNNSSWQGAGGLHNYRGALVVENTIIANNTSENSAFADVAGEMTADWSLFGVANVATITGANNMFDADPLLGPLGDNGGPTMTHALLPGSPALDAGDPTIAVDPPAFDQRGAPFVRVAQGVLLGVPMARIDIGAYEAQAPPSADFDANAIVSGRDFLVWQRGFGTTGATAADGDSDHDGDVDASDLAAWQVSYGDTIIVPPLAALYVDSEPSPANRAALVDAAVAVHLSRAESDEFAQPPVAPTPQATCEQTSAVPEPLPSPGRAETALMVERRDQTKEAQRPWLEEELLDRVFG